MFGDQSAHQDLGWQFHSPQLLAQQLERPAYANSLTAAGGVASSPVMALASSSGQMTGLTGSYGLIVGPGGSLLEIAIVLKGLLILAAQEPLSDREKKMLETARFLLITEMAMARGGEEEAVKEELDNALCQCKLRWPEPESIEV